MGWLARLRNLVHTDQHDRALDRELDFHIEERTDELVARGLSREEAYRQARIQFGHRQGLKEKTRDVGTFGWLESVANDIRYALRGLRATPAFTLTVVLSLALGIGANTAIFSLINSVLLKSLPVERPEELVVLGLDQGDEVTNPIWEAIRREQSQFDGVFAFRYESFNLSEGGEARRVDGNYVSGEYFKTLGVAPAVGRLIAESDDHRGCPAIAALGNSFWNAEYGADPAVVGKTITVNGHPFQVVGVAGPGFFGTEVGRSVKVYVPICADAIIQGSNSILDQRSYWAFLMMGRPKTGLSLEQLNAQLHAMSGPLFQQTAPSDWDAENLAHYHKMKLVAREATTGFSSIRLTYRPALLLLMGVVALVLLIACGNVANLLLARGTVRQREIAMRLALGAGRVRLVRQMFTESLLLALLGAATGFLFARWGSSILVRILSGTGRGIWLDLAPDVRVLGFTISVAVVTALLFGLVPAWRATRVDPQVAMRAQGRGVLSGSNRFTLGKALVLTQVALSLVLVIGAGLMLGTFRNLAKLDPGFRREGLLAVRLDLLSTGYDETRSLEIQRQGLERLRLVPGVKLAASAVLMPVSGAGWNGLLEIPGRPKPADRRDAMSFFNRVSTRYFETMGTRLIAGRDFSEQDAVGSVPVAIINETVANKFFPGTSPVGQEFKVETGPEGLKQYQVVGVVQDAKYRTLREKPTPTVYFAERQADKPGFSMTYMLLADGPPADIIPSVRAAIAEVDGRAVFSAFPLARQLDISLARERMLATLSLFFGGLALALALIGIYGIMAYSVARRRNEIGIRLALGAARGGVMRMVLTEVSRMLFLGVAAGVVIALATGKLVSGFLYGLSASDPVTMGLTAGGLIVVGLLAGAVPAWRASRLDPATALREAE